MADEQLIQQVAQTVMTPDVIFHTRERVEKKGRKKKGEESNPFEWVNKASRDIFGGKKIVLIGLPGAFTPTCSNDQLPGFEALAEEFEKKGVDEILCTSVNDAFTMYQWAQHLGIEKVKMLPDGNGDWASSIGMFVDKKNLGFGKRSWRYVLVIDDMVIKQSFIESGIMDRCPTDPYDITKPQFVLDNML